MIESLFSQLSQQFVAIFDSVIMPGVRIYWLYMLSAFVIAYLVLAWQRRKKDRSETGKTIIQEIFDRDIWFHRSAINDYVCYALNMFLAPAFRLASLGGGALAGTIAFEGLVIVNDGQVMYVEINAAWLAIYTLFSLAALDFGYYIGHYISHRVRLFWELHKVHHSAQVLTPVTLFRLHPLDLMLVNFCRGLGIGVSVSVGQFMFSESIGVLTILGVNVGTFLFSIVGANLRHSHIWLAYPRWLSYIFISPAMHQIHHSSLVQHHDRNFGSIFALWDWMFGTLYIPEKHETLQFGLYKNEDRDYGTVASLYVVPLVKIGKWSARLFSAQQR